MNLPSEKVHQLAGRLEEINRLNHTILIHRALIFLLHGRWQAAELCGDIFGSVLAMKKGGNK